MRVLPRYVMILTEERPLLRIVEGAVGGTTTTTDYELTADQAIGLAHQALSAYQIAKVKA